MRQLIYKAYPLALFILSCTRLQAQEEIHIYPWDTIRKYHIPMEILGVEEYRVKRDELIANLEYFHPHCWFHFTDSSRANLMVKRYRVEHIRDSEVIFIKEYVSSTGVNEIKERIRFSEYADIFKFKEFAFGLPFRVDTTGWTFTADSLEYFINDTFDEEVFDKESLNFIRSIPKLKELRNLSQVYDCHLSPCHCMAYIRPPISHQGTIANIEVVLSGCGETYYHWTFSFNRLTKNIAIHDKLKNKYYTLREWRKMAGKIK